MIIHYLPNRRKIYMLAVGNGQPSGGRETLCVSAGVC